MTAKPTLIERLLGRVCVDPESGCWRWPGARDGGGYGMIHVKKIPGKAKMAKTHRVAFEFFVGPVTGGMVIDHVWARGCRHRDCCNPDHMELVTPRENALRGRAGEINGRRNAAKTHCPQGHPYSGDNLYVPRHGYGRQCRACNRDRTARVKAIAKGRLALQHHDHNQGDKP